RGLFVFRRRSRRPLFRSWAEPLYMGVVWLRWLSRFRNTAREFQQAINANRFVPQQWNDGVATRVMGSDGIHLAQFVARTLTQQGRMGPRCRNAVVDDPSPRLDSGATQVGLQIRHFKHRRRLGQGHKKHLGLFVTGVPMPRAAAVQLRCRDERSLVSRLLPTRLGAQKAWSAITEPAMWACAEVLIRSFSRVDTSGSNFWPMSFATRIGIKIERALERRTRDQALERIPTPSMKPIVQSLMMTRPASFMNIGRYASGRSINVREISGADRVEFFY